MTTELKFAPQTYSGDRIVLMLGQHKIGAVFPPSTDTRIPQIWNWGFWLGSNGHAWSAGHENTELAAKNAVLSKGREWLQKGGIE